MSSLHHWRPDGSPLDRPQLATVGLTCYHCHQITRVPTRSLAKAEEAHWRERYERLMASLNDVVERCHRSHGTDPMQVWFQAELLKIRERFERGC